MPTPAEQTKLERFLMALPEGFHYGVRERMELRRLMVALAAEGAEPESAKDLRAVVGPLVCSSREQLREFRERFDAEWKLRPTDSGNIDGGGHGRWWMRAVAACLAAAVVVGTVVVARLRPVGAPGTELARPTAPETKIETKEESGTPGRVGGTVLAGGAPLAGADVWIPGQHRVTGPDGSYQFTQVLNPTVPTLVGHPRFRSAMVMTEGGKVDRTINLSPLEPEPVAPIGEIRLALTAPPVWVAGPPLYIAISADGSRVAARGRDGTVRVYSSRDSSELTRIRSSAELMLFNQDGSLTLFPPSPAQTYRGNWMPVEDRPNFFNVASVAYYRGDTIVEVHLEDSNLRVRRDGHTPVEVQDRFDRILARPGKWPERPEAVSLSGTTRWLWIATTNSAKTAELLPLRWVAAALPALAIAAGLWWLMRHRSRLNRINLDHEASTAVYSPPRPEPPFRDRRTQTLAREMRRRKPSASLELAPEATVLKTAHSGGFLTPVYTAPTRPREFLVLVGRVGAGDQHERLYSALLDSLRDQGAYIDRYTFHGSPDRIRDIDGKGWTDLAALSARHPDYDVWIVADPAALVHSFEEAPDWARDLARWPDRALLSPVDVDDRVRALFDAEGVPIGVATSDGLASMLGGGAAPGQLDGGRFPSALRRLPSRWVDNASPGERQAAEVMSTLPAYLGADGALLAGACSVYPETFWTLTLWLAQKLIPVTEADPLRRERALVRVTSLPWFRYGRIPDWLRKRLLNRLPEAEKERVRKAVEEFLSRASPDAAAGTDKLEVITSERGRPGQTRDYVMYSFLLGHKLDESLSTKPPPAWRKLLFKGGRAVFGARAWPMVGAALGLGACAWLLADAALNRVPTRVDLTAWNLPDRAPSPPPARTREFPTDPMRRLMVVVADSLMGASVSGEFDSYVAKQAASFLLGKPTAEAGKAEVGTAFNGGIIESIEGNQATVIKPRGVERTQLTGGRFLNYRLTTGSSETPVVPLPPLEVAGWCVGQPIPLFNNTNRGAVDNNGAPPAFDTKGKKYCLESIYTYHWNNGRGAPAGLIWLEQGKGSTVVGKWQAAGSSGQGGAPNANWLAEHKGGRMVLDGPYTIRDSSPQTWSSNRASGGKGFARVMVREFQEVLPTGVKPVPTAVTRMRPLVAMVVTKLGGVELRGAGLVLRPLVDRILIATSNDLVRRGKETAGEVKVLLHWMSNSYIPATVAPQYDEATGLAVLVIDKPTFAIPDLEDGRLAIGTPQMWAVSARSAIPDWLTDEAAAVLAETPESLVGPAKGGLQGAVLFNDFGAVFGMAHLVRGRSVTLSSLAPVLRRWGFPTRAGGRRRNPYDKQDYVWIPQGSYVMGCSTDDKGCAANEEPRRNVGNRGFWLGQLESVISVTRPQAIDECAKAGGRLPTEKEWEYAARGETNGPRYGDVDQIAWHSGNSDGRVHPVATKAPNGFGLYDMLGNRAEWVSDPYRSNLPGGSPAESNLGVVRGGAWNAPPDQARASARVAVAVTELAGFRCVWEASAAAGR
jgi:hypothetical protein